LHASGEELGELTDLAAELVELATDSREAEPVSRFDLVSVTAAVVERVQRRTGRIIELSGVDSALVSGRAAMIDRAITNLVENAVKFSPADTPVDVIIGERSVQVRDGGPGIPEEDQERIFDRFYRSTITRSAPGSGLGLAIVKQTIDAHGGAVFATDNPGGGAIVGFELPVV
jgi:two-component system sensor histidine kinase MprB